MTDRHPLSVLRSVPPAEWARGLSWFAAVALVTYAIMGA